MEYLGPMEAVQGRLWMWVHWYAGLQDLLKRKFLFVMLEGSRGMSTQTDIWNSIQIKNNDNRLSDRIFVNWQNLMHRIIRLYQIIRLFLSDYIKVLDYIELSDLFWTIGLFWIVKIISKCIKLLDYIEL